MNRRQIYTLNGATWYLAQLTQHGLLGLIPCQKRLNFEDKNVSWASMQKHQAPSKSKRIKLTSDFSKATCKQNNDDNDAIFSGKSKKK